MADEAQVTPVAEEIAATGSLDSIEHNDTKKEAETVPLSTYLALKDDLKEIKRELRESKSKPQEPTAREVSELADKYNVDESFIQDMLATATAKAAQEIEAKYVPQIKELKAQKDKETFDKKFDALYKSELAALKEEGVEIPDGVNVETIKALAVANSKTPVRDILKGLYPPVERSRWTTENDARPAMDIVSDVIDVRNLTKEQERRVLADPTARQKYYDMLDGLR